MNFWYPLAVPTIGDDEINAVTRVLRSGRTTMGEQVEHFEDRFRRVVGAQHAVMVNSGSSADLLLAFALRPRLSVDQVLVPAVTWPTQVWAWAMAGFDVRLVDVTSWTLNADADCFAEAITNDTALLSLVHLMGNPCHMEPILKLGLPVTEDCCEALGAFYAGHPVGTFGLGATWSFFFSHQMTTMEGGMVTTDDADLADQLRGLRSHGWTRHVSDEKYTFADWGFNVRPTEVQAAIGLVQLEKLPRLNHARRRNYERFAAAIEGSDIHLPVVPQYSVPSPFGLPLIAPDRATRDRLVASLEAHGIETRPILAGNLARQPVARKRLFSTTDLVGANTISDRGFYIGLHPFDNGDIEKVAGIVCQVPVAA